MNDLAFSILWEELRGEIMKADLYKEKNKLIREGRHFRTMLKDESLTNTLGKDKIFELKEVQDKHYKKTMFYSGLLKALEKTTIEEDIPVMKEDIITIDEINKIYGENENE